VHSQFSKDLILASKKESVHTIADCFITNKEKFLIYGEYCSNLLPAQDLLDNVCNTMPAVQNLVTVRGVSFAKLYLSFATFSCHSSISLILINLSSCNLQTFFQRSVLQVFLVIDFSCL